MKQPYVDWTNSLSDRAESEKENPYTLESINDDPAAYLIPEILDYMDLESFIEHSWVILFELQLSGWSTDESLWPKKRTLKMFKEWFDLRFSSLAIDLWGKEPLSYQD